MAVGREEFSELDKKIKELKNVHLFDLLCIASLLNEQEIPKDLFIEFFQSALINEAVSAKFIKLDSKQGILSLEANVSNSLQNYISDNPNEEATSRVSDKVNALIKLLVGKLKDDFLSSEKRKQLVLYAEKIMEKDNLLSSATLDKDSLVSLTLEVAKYFQEQNQLEQAVKYYELAKSKLKANTPGIDLFALIESKLTKINNKLQADKKPNPAVVAVPEKAVKPENSNKFPTKNVALYGLGGTALLFGGYLAVKHKDELAALIPSFGKRM